MTTDGVSYMVTKLLYIKDQKLVSTDISKTQSLKNDVNNQLHSSRRPCD